MADNLKDRTVWISVPLDVETVERLRNLSDACHADPDSVAASLLHDILKDDEECHYLLTAPTGTATFN